MAARIRQLLKMQADDDDVHDYNSSLELGERRWFVLERPRRDINGESETAK